MPTTTTNNAAREERRAQMLEKVRKLLAMAKDGRGNANEEDTAMRQANKIMAQWGIAEAEADLSMLDAGEMSFGEALAGMDGRAPRPGVVHKSYQKWVGILSLGVAKFTDSIAVRRETENGQMLVFRGEKNDVLLARWLLAVLVIEIERELSGSGWRGKDPNAFRIAAAGTLQVRLIGMAAERVKMYREAQRKSNSRALVVVDRKAMVIAEIFGKQKTSRNGRFYGSAGAYVAGSSAGQRINIPGNRPLTNAGARRAIAR
jgi:hypothetical protein